MNKSTISVRHRAIFILILSLSACVFYPAGAQGFFTLTDHIAVGQFGDIALLPDGYRLKVDGVSNDPDGGYFLGDLRLNAAGEVVSWDSFNRHQPLGYVQVWLPGDDFLYSENAFFGSDLTIWKSTFNGDLIWSRSFATTFNYSFLQDAKQNAAGELIFLNAEMDQFGSYSPQILNVVKLAANGDLLWTFNQPLPDSTDLQYTILPTNDGGCVYSLGIATPDGATWNLLNKISSSGQLMWSDTIEYFTKCIRENAQGEIITFGTGAISYQPVYQGRLKKFDANGQLLWAQNLNTLFQKESVLSWLLLLSENGNLLITGKETSSIPFYQAFFASFDPGGNLLWKNNYSTLGQYFDSMHSGAATPDGGFIVEGLFQPNYNMYILKIDADGNLFPGSVTGRLALDNNVDCLIDTTEQRLANWKVQLKSPQYTFYASTDSSGHYELGSVPGGDYLLSAVTNSSLWESCNGSVPVAISDTSSLVQQQDFPIQILADCPFMTVDIGTAVLRRCFSSTYHVHYCNNGTVAADSASVQIVLDPLLHFDGANIPYTLDGNVLTFPLGAVAVLECGQFTFDVTVDCDSTELGQTICVSAAIFPDSICNPPTNWSGALLEGSGQCSGDSVRFHLRNIGNAPSSNMLNFIVVDDHVIMMSQPLPSISPMGSYDLSVPADGSTWRLLADQEPNAPGLEMPSVGVEGCGPGSSPSWGFMMQFPNRDGNPFTDRDCREVVGSFDPNDKQAFPTGVDDQHFIERNQPLDYLVRFQNTGTDTAFTVVVKDTLSAWLNPASVHPGAASHQYEWSLSGTGILTFTFNNILLPDSNVNEAASHGFIQFSIDQQPDLPLGTIVVNRAGIYFDFNEPVMTNTVFHTIGKNFLTTAAQEPAASQDRLEIWPNPAGQSTTIWSGKPFQSGQFVLLRNTLGQVVGKTAATDPSVELQRAGLPAGLYFVEWQDARGVLRTGKIMWE